MSITGTLTSDEIKRAIAFEDAKEIARANGIGKKTAERIILELKDKIGSPIEDKGAVSMFTAGGDPDRSDSRGEAINALISLGYTKAEAFGAVSSVNEEGLSSEEYIKRALKNLF